MFIKTDNKISVSPLLVYLFPVFIFKDYFQKIGSSFAVFLTILSFPRPKLRKNIAYNSFAIIFDLCTKGLHNSI